MSFTSDYLAQEKKKKKKSTGDSFTDAFLEYEEKEIAEFEKAKQQEKAEKEDWRQQIAAQQETVDERKWFEKGAFEDGYQFGDVVKTLLGTGADLSANITGGALEMGEKVVDAGAYLVGGAAKLFGGDKFADDVQGFIKKDLYDGEKIAANTSALPTRVILGLLGEDDYDEVSVFGEKTDSLAQSGGQLAGTIALQAVGVPWFVTSGVTSFGSATEGAFKEGASYGEAGLSSAISAGAEILTEKLFGGSGLGEKGLINLDALTKGISNKVVKALADVGVDMAAEGSEEVVSSVIDRLGSALYKEEKLAELLLSEEAVDEYVESFIGGAVLGGVANTGKAASSIKTGRDYRTGLVGDEQAVFDAEYNKRIAEAEKDGSKLTKKEKAEIYDEVMNDLEKGYISTDSIEEVLGGADYNSYQDTVKNEDALLKELNELRNMKSGDMTDIQKDRLAELKGMNLTDTTKRDGLKTKLTESVYGLVKDTKLAESYNERARRGQTFEADLSGYDTKQAKIVQKAIDSGILNNTRRTHEFVDMVAKISADKGVLFDFANNAKLKESGFAVDGATINGFVNKDGITVNIDSAKSLNSVVGHEIAHVLEGTELYAEMQTAMFEYAKAKGDYQGRYDTLTKLYKDVEGADVDAELTADLVGDYLFTDNDFINNLSTKHRNVFQKIYDELKYLCKVATAGSKEARELEKVKRAFDKAYKESGKTEGTKYSISDKNIKDVSTGYAYGESYYTMSYTQDGKVVGTLEYGEYNGEPNVKMIEVDSEYRRKGIATKLLQELQNKYPGVEIDFGMSTPDGTKLLDSITYDVTDEAVVADRQRLKDLQTELNDLQGKLDVLFDTENLTEAQDNELHELGDRWQEVYETIGKLEKDLRGKKATKTFVKTDTKYSLSDSDGKQLTNEQREYFKDSKMRDDNGNLKVMYHGSQDAGFHVFDPSMSDDGISLFFVDRNDVATSYSGTSETYEAQTIRTAEDMNNFIESIGAEGYEVVENDGKFTLIYEGDRVADADTAQGIYKEFCWYEGVGEGDANYKVYLNLTNPLVVDAKGRPWNKIDAEFSQEIYDKYKSLTAEEKAALADLAEWEDFRIFNSEIQEARGDVLASAYAKMGEDCNIYDLFSVAADNFSEEAMRENARGYLKTRDYAQRAKEGGYDGVILKNIIDNGGYSNGDEGASTVAIAFNPEQVKSVANEKPTGDPDIRYSLTEYTAEEKKAHNDAVLNHFGKTYSWAETGYLLLDGTRLDLSGKHDGAPGGYRTVDHRDITEALGYDYGGGDYSGSLVQFMSEGNIRIIPECNGINLSVKPTKAQEQALSTYISRYRGEVMLDIDDLNGNTVVSVEYPYGTYYTKVLNDIREWFDNGIKPENAGRYSLTKEGSTPKRYGSYNVSGKDIALDVAPVQDSVQDSVQVDEAVAPVVDEAVDYAVDKAPSLSEIYGEEYAPVENAYTVEQEMKALQDEMVAVYEEYNALKNEGKDAEAQPLFDKFLELNERGQELFEKAEAYKAEEQSVADSLTDADVPPEVEAPYYEDGGIIDPFEDRDIKAVGNQKVKAYMYENPEVKPFFQEEANILLGELRNTTKGEKFYTETPDGQAGVYGAESYGHWTGTARQTTSDIEYLLDALKMSYADIEKGLNAIIEDNGAENIAAAKRIEFILNDRLMNGYQDISGVDIPANQEYRDLIKEKGVTEYNEEAFRRLISEFNANLPKQTEDIAPTFDTARKDQIPGQQSIYEDAPTETAEAEEPKIAKVLESTPKEQKKGKLATKVRNLVFDKQSVIEDISLKTKNRELMGKADFMLRSESRAQRHIKNKLMPILERVEMTGNRQAFEEYAYHLHNIDRMSLEGKAQARIAELEGKFKDLKPEQVKAIAAKEITDKTTERTANTIREAKEYLNALETKNKPVFGDEVTADVSREIVKKFEAEHKDARDISEAITEYNNELRQMLVDGGIISQETADLWANMYPHYVPIRRAGKDGAAVKVPLDSMRTGVNAPIARAKGGNSDIESLLDVMGSRTEQVYRAVARNNFGVELMHTLDTVTDTEATSIDEILEAFENKTDELLKAGENGANPKFTVFEDGQRITFDITEELYDALKPTNDLLKADIPIMSFLTKIQRGILTQYNPTFIATNAVKDIQDVLVNSQHATKTYANVPLAIKELVKGKGKWITEYMDNGGEDLTYFDSKKQVFKKQDSTAKKVLGFVPDKIAKANDFVEKIPRLAEYIASRKSGASVEVAMLDAARVTTNFAAGGDLTKFANKNGFTFLNASVQGAAQQVRNVREAKANGFKGAMQLAAKYAIAGLPVMLLNHLLWDDDEEYEELSDYVKDNYYVVAKYGDGKFVRIPKGRVTAVIQHGFEQMKNLITGDDEVDFGRFAELVVENIAPNNPLDNNVLAPLDQAINNKTWYGEDLVPTRLQNLPEEEQFDETTDAISKWLGEVTNTSPYKWNYVIDQYSGGLGDVVLPYLTPESDGGGVLAPFIDKFTTDGVMKNQNVSDFYETVDELTKNANSMYATEEDILSSKYINSISAELGELYAQKREIQNSNLSDEKKDAAVRDIQKQIDALAKESLGAYSSIDYQSARDGEYANIGNRYFKLDDDGEWQKLSDEQVIKYKVTSAAGDAPYASDGTNHYRWYEPGEDAGEDAEAGWRKITEQELERQNEVTDGLGISPEEYWGNKDEYCFAYDSPGKYAVSKAVGGYKAYKTYSSELYDIKADKDEDGKSISGSRKEKVIGYVNSLDIDYGERLILFKNEYNADDTYNYDIIDYLNNREDISYEEMATILKEIGFTVDAKGNISWD